MDVGHHTDDLSPTPSPSDKELPSDAAAEPFRDGPDDAASAQAAGCRVVSGLDLLLAQGVRQFALFTGCPAPVAAMREALRAAAAQR